MDRVLASEARGCWFDPSRARQLVAASTVKTLSVTVKPGSRATALSQQADGSWLAQVAAAPIDGAANEAVIKLVAEHFGLRRAQVRIKSGLSSRSKRVEIDDGA
jgi:uncharacterized protein YggU (UPF0235/DUF167 family)